MPLYGIRINSLEHSSLKMGRRRFSNFIRKRLLIYSRNRSSLFYIWHEFMPDKVRNETHRIDEPSFSYILRHTLFRPRHVLDHLQNILDRWDRTSNSFRVDPTFIPSVIAKNNYELAKMVINQLEIAHPGVGAFMQSWSGSSSIILVNDFQSKNSAFHGLSDDSGNEQAFRSILQFRPFWRCQEIQYNGRLSADTL